VSTLYHVRQWAVSSTYFYNTERHTAGVSLPPKAIIQLTTTHAKNEQKTTADNNYNDDDDDDEHFTSPYKLREHEKEWW